MNGFPSVDDSSHPASNDDVLVSFSDRSAAVIPDVFDSSQVFFDVINMNPSSRVQGESAGHRADPADIVV